MLRQLAFPCKRIEYGDVCSVWQTKVNAFASKMMMNGAYMRLYEPSPDLAEDDVRGNLDYAKAAKLILKVEMKRRDMTYQDLSQALAEIGIEESVPNLRNKISRGSFTGHFMLECMAAMRVPSLDLSMLYVERNRKGTPRRAAAD